MNKRLPTIEINTPELLLERIITEDVEVRYKQHAVHLEIGWVVFSR